MTFSFAGNLLVASTLVTDTVFARGVCLTMQHDENGAIAVMLNRPIWPPPAELIQLITGGSVAEPQDSKPTAGTSRLDSIASQLLPPEPAPQMSRSGFIHFGGPLSGPVLAIHGSLTLAEAQTGSGIYVAAQKEHLEQLIRDKISDYRLIIGHAGWSSGQLEAEIDAGLWHVLPATAELVFGGDDDLWPVLIRRATGSSLARWVGAPDNPVAMGLN
jgi:putative transcriptional regulator